MRAAEGGGWWSADGEVELEVLSVEEGNGCAVGLVREGSGPKDVEDARIVGVAGGVGAGMGRVRRRVDGEGGRW